jgi:hypothetical protein
VTDLLILFVIVILLASLAVWAFRTAPFIQPPFRQWGEWGTIAIAAVIIIFQIVIPLLHTIHI